MEYVPIEEARKLRGLRLVLTANMPGPWGEAAKAVFSCRNVPFVPVAQEALKSNEELVAWTGIRNAPIAVYDDEPAVAGWIELLHLAERLGSGPSLLPEDPLDRAIALGLTAQISSPMGLGWNRRLEIFTLTSPEELNRAYGRLDAGMMPKLAAQYVYTPEEAATAPERVATILTGLDAQLRRQKEQGRDYFVGDRLSVVDLHWAAFCGLLVPLPPEVNPMPEGIRAIYGNIGPTIKAALTPALIAHRDLVYERHLTLPLDF